MEQAVTLYSNAKQALSEYKTVDQVKDFRDKALAVEAYAKQANDHELERDAALARVRAERRCGQLLNELEKAKGSQGQLQGRDSSGGSVVRPPEKQPKTLSEMGLTKDQSSKFQKLAAVPEDEFEAAVNQPGAKPSTNSIIKKPSPEKREFRMDEHALWWWGRLTDMERDGRFDRPLSDLKDEMTDNMRADVERLLPKIREYFQ